MFGERLAAMREARKKEDRRFTQPFVAEALGVGDRTYAALERGEGEAPIGLDLVEEVGRVLGCGPAPFLAALFPQAEKVSDEALIAALRESTYAAGRDQFRARLAEPSAVEFIALVASLPPPDVEQMLTWVRSRARDVNPAGADFAELLHEMERVGLATAISGYTDAVMVLARDDTPTAQRKLAKLRNDFERVMLGKDRVPPQQSPYPADRTEPSKYTAPRRRRGTR